MSNFSTFKLISKIQTPTNSYKNHSIHMLRNIQFQEEEIHPLLRYMFQQFGSICLDIALLLWKYTALMLDTYKQNEVPKKKPQYWK